MCWGKSMPSPNSDIPRLHPTGIGVIASRVGTSPHLVDLTARTDRSLCGVGLDFTASCAWFGMVGCKKCARLGLRGGLTEICDIDGEMVQLHDVVERD